MNFVRQIYWISTIIISLTLLACVQKPQTMELSGYTMGTSYSVHLVAPENTQVTDELAVSIRETLTELDHRFSTYINSSEISQFNNSSSEDWIEISPEFLNVLEEGLHIGELSNGAFDMTIGPLVDLWGFGPSESRQTVPANEDIETLIKTTGSNYLEVRNSPPSIRKTQPLLKLDLSAIAKGFAVDQIWEMLAQAGFTNYMVEIGGEIRTRGMSADNNDWMIGIENPIYETELQTNMPIKNIVPLRDSAIATSGDYRNYFLYEGIRYSHAIDPRTGWPVSNDIAAVSVIADKAIKSDALATASMVLGKEATMHLAEKKHIAIQLTLRTNNGMQIINSPAYESYLANF
ncbi:MAG: hypothetical protein CMM56_07275 [Rhodospirillaceae bacterium]|nr:hypothetical protein [Rhodospirillaceae bacterium]